MRGPRQLLCVFAGLQVLDLLSTLLFLRQGVAEANPLIRISLAVWSQPAFALAIPKILAIAFAVAACSTGRTRLLSKVNFFYGACLAWNLAALSLRMSQTG